MWDFTDVFWQGFAQGCAVSVGSAALIVCLLVISWRADGR